MKETFIGMGSSPEGIDIPLGLSMELAMHPRAASTFGQMSPGEKHAAIRYIQACTSGEDAKRRIQNAISQMEQGHTRLS